MSLQDNEKNKRLHETIANLERPELLAREWLIEWDKKHKLHPSQDTCVASLSALLAQHAVAEPQSMKALRRLVVEYDNCTTSENFTERWIEAIEQAKEALGLTEKEK